jgi:HEPN domain-containing protein
MLPEEAEVKRWLNKARSDHRTAQVALAQDPPIADVAAFHCQQAVEKLFKAYLVWQRDEFEKIHDLRALANECAKHDPDFASLRERVAPLTPFAVRFRYPGPADPSVQQVQNALDVVQHVWDFIVSRLPAEVRP